MLANGLRHSLLLFSLVASSFAQAELRDGDPVILLAGEIVIGDGVEVSASGGKIERASKKKNAQDKMALPAPLELDEGVLSPRGGAPADQREYEARVREEERIRDALRRQVAEDLPRGAAVLLQVPGVDVSGSAPLPAGRSAPAVSNRDRAGALRDKARAYGE